MRSRPVDNPANRFRDQVTTYDDGEGPPPATITLIDDHSRSILSHNDSPDLGFRWSVNPYRGCQHACAYCIDGQTPILLGDGRTKPIAELKIGDEIYGTTFDGKYRRYVRTQVLDHWTTRKLAYRISLRDGTKLIASGDHRFLSNRGWKHVMPADRPEPCPHLTLDDSLIGTGESPPALEETICETELDILSIAPLDVRPLFDITTGTGDFIANGVISHNCYARPTHEFLDLGAGTDFDTKIVVKREAATLLRAAFEKPSWQGELVMFSGVTDCYQPVERELTLTRQCLEVCAEYGNPVAIITKSALIERDLDVLKQLAERASISVAVSLCFSDNELARAIEPWAPSPDRRFKLIETLAGAGIPVAVMAAPMIPGLNDNQLVTILERAAAAGATRAGWVLLRLPGAVEQVFSERVRAAVPLAADKILHRIRETRGGEKLYDPRFHTRGRGEGVYAEMIAQLFDKTCARLGLGARVPLVERDTFQRPAKPSVQLSLF